MTPADLDAMMEGVMGSAREWSEPYTLVNMGKWFMLKAHGMPVASYDVDRWGSEEACIEAAWQHAYGASEDAARDLLAAEVRAQRETIAGLEARVEALTRAAQAIQENANGSFEMDDGERGYLVHSDDMDRLKNVVSRKRSVSVPRCTAETTARLYSQPHQCPYAAVVQIDGDWLCQKHADLWAQAEGRAALSGETPNAAV